ncbi:MAG TPA: hypothetical protein VLC52_09150 [Anaerolineae bacterium]|nr:hypothetical protein [Anaerolineae bacterium]
MEAVCLPLGLGALGLLALLGVGAVVLVKLGVLVKYATKEEPSDSGTYDLDQSHEPDHQ